MSLEVIVDDIENGLDQRLRQAVQQLSDVQRRVTSKSASDVFEQMSTTPVHKIYVCDHDTFKKYYKKPKKAWSRSVKGMALMTIYSLKEKGVIVYSASAIMPFIGYHREKVYEVVPDLCDDSTSICIPRAGSKGKDMYFVTAEGLMALLLHGRMRANSNTRKTPDKKQHNSELFCCRPGLSNKIYHLLSQGISQDSALQDALAHVGDTDKLARQIKDHQKRADDASRELFKLRQERNELQKKSDENEERLKKIQDQLIQKSDEFENHVKLLKQNDNKLKKIMDEAEETRKELVVNDLKLQEERAATLNERKRKMECQTVFTGKRRRILSLWSAFDEKEQLSFSSSRNKYGVTEVYRQAMSVLVDNAFREVQVGLTEALLKNFTDSKMNGEIRETLCTIIPELTGEKPEDFEADGGKDQVDAIKTFRNPIQLMGPVRNSLKRVNKLVNSSVEISVRPLLEFVIRYNKFARDMGVTPIYVQDDMWMVVTQSCNGLELAEKLRQADEAVSQDKPLQFPKARQMKLDEMFPVCARVKPEPEKQDDVEVKAAKDHDDDDETETEEDDVEDPMRELANAARRHYTRRRRIVSDSDSEDSDTD